MYSKFIETDNKWDFLKSMPEVAEILPTDSQARARWYTDVKLFTTDLIGGYTQNPCLVIPAMKYPVFEAKRGKFLREYFNLRFVQVGNLCVITTCASDYPPTYFCDVSERWKLVHH